MGMPTSKLSSPHRLWTADELLALPDDDQHYELVAGELEVMPPAGGRHGQIIMGLGILLGHHVRAHRLGVIFSPDTGFVLARNPDTVRAPDLGFLSATRLRPSEVGAGYLEGAPDLAVEVLSPRDRKRKMEEKVADYLARGARLVWVIDSRRRSVAVHAPGAAPRVLGADDLLDGGDVVPGFACRVRDALDWPE